MYLTLVANINFAPLEATVAGKTQFLIIHPPLPSNFPLAAIHRISGN
jgi:hypothetical protein